MLTFVGCNITVTTEGPVEGPVEVVPAQPGISMAAMQEIATRNRFTKRFDPANAVAARLKVVFSHRRLTERVICATA